MTKPRILITNDDGIHNPGIKHLWQSLKDYAELIIIAPESESSGSALSTTVSRPLQICRVSWEDNTEAWAINGTTTDCVKLGLSIICKKKPDLIVSGINRGSNAGRNVLYSGTVGGVIEGSMQGIPGIAFSHVDFHDPHYLHIEQFITPIVDYFFKNSFPIGSFLNVNFPLSSCKRIRGFKMAKQGKGFWAANPDERLHPLGIPYYWMGGKWSDCEEEEDSDVALLEKGYMTAVPIYVSELTHYEVLRTHKKGFEEMFAQISESSSNE